MRVKPASKTKRKLVPPPQSANRESLSPEKLRLIVASMARWEDMDQAGRTLGRGLGRKVLLDRVAAEVGTTTKVVQDALASR